MWILLYRVGEQIQKKNGKYNLYAGKTKGQKTETIATKEEVIAWYCFINNAFNHGMFWKFTVYTRV